MTDAGAPDDGSDGPETPDATYADFLEDARLEELAEERRRRTWLARLAEDELSVGAAVASAWRVGATVRLLTRGGHTFRGVPVGLDAGLCRIRAVGGDAVLDLPAVVAVETAVALARSQPPVAPATDLHAVLSGTALDRSLVLHLVTGRSLEGRLTGVAAAAVELRGGTAGADGRAVVAVDAIEAVGLPTVD